jgi:hypothetical protein
MVRFTDIYFAEAISPKGNFAEEIFIQMGVSLRKINECDEIVE